MHDIFHIFHRLHRNPGLAIPATIAWLNGLRYRILFFISGKKFYSGRFLRVYGKLYISGPGSVRFGDNCLVISNAIRPVCIRTLTRNAEVLLGNSAGLNGTSIQCAKSVTVGNLSNIADAYITDTPAHSIDKNRRELSINDIPAYTTRIGDNVWISVQTVILHGVSIGDNSVIGACSLVRKAVPANVFAAGNPLKILRNIET